MTMIRSFHSNSCVAVGVVNHILIFLSNSSHHLNHYNHHSHRHHRHHHRHRLLATSIFSLNATTAKSINNNNIIKRSSFVASGCFSSCFCYDDDVDDGCRRLLIPCRHATTTTNTNTNTTGNTPIMNKGGGDGLCSGHTTSSSSTSSTSPIISALDNNQFLSSLNNNKNENLITTTTKRSFNSSSSNNNSTSEESKQEQDQDQQDDNDDDYYEILGLNTTTTTTTKQGHNRHKFDISLIEMKNSYRMLMNQYHPDKQQQQQQQQQKSSDNIIIIDNNNNNDNENNNEMMVDYASKITNAYQILKEPHSRAKHLLKLVGHPLDENTQTTINLGSSDFLLEVMEIREEIENITSSQDNDNIQKLQQLEKEINSKIDIVIQKLNIAFDIQQDYIQAQLLTSQLQYLRRMKTAIKEKE